MRIISRAEAKALGLKTCFTGVECVNGHIAERYVISGGCLRCNAEAGARSYIKHKGKVQARTKAAYEGNRKHKLAASAAWLAANKERKKATNAARYARVNEHHRAVVKAYVEANKDRMRAAAKEWSEANPEKVKAKYSRYAKRHPDRINAKTHNRRARIKGNGGKHTSDDIKWLLAKQKWRCAHPWCKASLKSGRHVDHITPIKLGGSNDRKNLQLLCEPCNHRKSSKHPIDFAQSHGMLL